MTRAGVDGRAAARPWLPWVALGLGIVALLLAILPWTGLAASLLAVAVSAVSWRRSSAGPIDDDGRRPGLGLSQAATGLAVSVLAVTVVWSLVATVVPKQQPQPLDCDSRTLSPADQIRCDQVIR